MGQQSVYWWFLFVNDKHVMTYGTRREALDEMDRRNQEQTENRCRVERGTRRVAPNPGYYVNYDMPSW